MFLVNPKLIKIKIKAVEISLFLNQKSTTKNLVIIKGWSTFTGNKGMANVQNVNMLTFDIFFISPISKLEDQNSILLSDQ